MAEELREPTETSALTDNDIRRLAAELMVRRKNEGLEDGGFPEPTYNEYEQLLVEHPHVVNAVIRDILRCTHVKLKSYTTKDPTMARILKFFTGKTANDQRKHLQQFLDSNPAYRTENIALLYYRLKALSDNEFDDTGVPSTRYGLDLYYTWGFRSIKTAE
jgi:hypothetical protein